MRVTRVAEMSDTDRDFAKAVFDRRSSKFEGSHYAELEFHTELYSAEGEAITIYCTEETPESQRTAAVRAAKLSSDIVFYEFLIVPKEWLDTDRFIPGKRVKPWIHAAKRTLTEGALRVHRQTNEVIPEFKSGGVLLDHTTGNMLVTVHTAVKEMLLEKLKTASPEEKNKISKQWFKFRHFPIVTAVNNCWKLVKK